MEGGVYKGTSTSPNAWDIKGVLHGDSSEMYMDVEFGQGCHKYVYTSDRWIAGNRESKMDRFIRMFSSGVVSSVGAQSLLQNCFVTLLLGELKQDES